MQQQQKRVEEGKEQTKQPRSLHTRVLLYLLLFLFLGVGFLVLSLYMTGHGRMERFVAMTRFSQSVDEPPGLDRWVRPPSSLVHDMSDGELFWVASMAPLVEGYPFRRVPKVAFMFLTRGPLPLYPLWEKFLRGHESRYSIYIHSLPGYEPDYPSASPFYRRQIPSQIAEWGKMSICDAERRLLANALLDISNEWFVLVSESCIPFHNFSIVYHYLMRSKFSFMGVFDDKGPFGRGRYNRSMDPLVKLEDWRKGSQWFEVNRKLAQIIISDNTYYPLFRDSCKPHCYVDEHYFPTMLSIEAPHLLANRSITWVDWSRGGAHPGTFGMVDITEEFLNRVRGVGPCDYNGQVSTVCVLFGRKFAPSTLKPLMYLAPEVLGYG